MATQESAPTARITLSTRRRSSQWEGHQWVYESHIGEVAGRPAAGDVVDVFTADKRFCGRGFFNPHSKIRVRLLSCLEEPIDEGFFRSRLTDAQSLRTRVVHRTNAYRMVFGESDGLPGLVVDRYRDIAVMQTLSYGMDRRKHLLADLLHAQAGLSAIYLRNDSKSRAQEGLPIESGFIRGNGTSQIEIVEGQATFTVDVAKGQKTGWFCDQRENRLATAVLAQGCDVLDVFCHTGAFGIHAVQQGAKSVMGIDASESALASARAHAALNKVDHLCEFRQADAFDELRCMDRAGKKFDLIILDPPAFARTRQAVPHALSGYKDINLCALRLLRRGGFLVSSSCSYYMTEVEFWRMMGRASRDANRSVRLIEQRGQAQDHPVLTGMPETRYLKCFIVQAL